MRSCREDRDEDTAVIGVCCLLEHGLVVYFGVFGEHNIQTFPTDFLTSLLSDQRFSPFFCRVKQSTMCFFFFGVTKRKERNTKKERRRHMCGCSNKKKEKKSAQTKQTQKNHHFGKADKTLTFGECPGQQPVTDAETNKEPTIVQKN